FFMPQKGTAGIINTTNRQGFLLIHTSPQVLGRVTKSTLWTVGTGFILFLLILVLGLKIKIFWIALPLSFYLIAQLFVYTNHVKTVKNQRIYFDPQTSEVYVERLPGIGMDLHFNLLRDVIEITEVRSVQKNRGTLYGYYRLRLKNDILIIPYLVEQHDHSGNKAFFASINNNFKIEVEIKLFPII